MTTPGVTVTPRDSAVSSSPPLDSGACFAAGLADRGPVDKAVLIRNLDQFVDSYGGRQTYGYLYDFAEHFFDEGGALLWVARAVGPGAVKATRHLSDGSGNTLRVDAASPGGWGNNLTISTTHPTGTTFQLVIKESGTVVETSPIFNTNAEAVLWSADSAYIRLFDEGGADPAVASDQALSTGTDDRASITSTQQDAALALFTKDKGPGQVCYPGGTTTALHTSLLAHAGLNNRTAILDGADTSTVSTLTTEAATLRALGENSRYGGIFAPWVKIKGPSTDPGSTRTVPPSALVCGVIARHDAETYNPVLGVSNPNDPAAGKNGRSKVALDLSQEAFDDSERGTLNDAGVSLLRVIYGEVRVYGYRTLANQLTDKLHSLLNNRRLDATILAAATVIGEQFEFRQIDGRGHLFSDFAGVLVGEILLPYFDLDALFGETAQDAFSVDVGDQVNTAETIAAGKARAVMSVARSPFAEAVEIEYVKEEL